MFGILRILRIAFKLLVNDRAKFAALLVGITFSVFLMIEMTSLFSGISPKIELADQREERVDVRVLPVIFRFHKPKFMNLYPGQLVDVYIGQR